MKKSQRMPEEERMRLIRMSRNNRERVWIVSPKVAEWLDGIKRRLQNSKGETQ